MTTLLIPYKRGSASARALAEALGIRRVRLPTNDRWSRRAGSAPLFINWGNTEIWHKKYRVINNCGAVQRARDKLHTLRVLKEHGVPTVEFTDSLLVAQEWQAHEDIVVQRNTTTGQSGAGIVVVHPGMGLSRAPLYTKAFRARHEYRVHVAFDKAIDAQKKRRRDGVVPGLIRNLENGYVFCREGLTVPPSVMEVARQSVAAIGLDFGAVDILCKESGPVAVLEINTAPGLEGTTIERYAEAFRSYV